MSQKMTPRIIIVGDGLVALTLALTLAERGLKDVCIIGPYLTKITTKEPDGRSTAIFQKGLSVLAQAGVWPLPKNAYAPLPTMILKRDSGDQVVFVAKQAGFDVFGANVPNHVLWQTLQAKVLAHKKIHCVASKVVAVQLPENATQNYATLTTECGQTLQATLVLAADGRQSVVRQAANINLVQQKNRYNQTALVAVLTHTQPHNNDCVEWQRTGGPFTLVPLPNPHQMALVWCEPADKHTQFLADDMVLQCDSLSCLSENYVGDITHIANISTWPVQPQHAKKLTAPRAWLLGEAAHILPPLAAQGFNLSLADIAVAADLLVQAQSVGQDMGDDYLAHQYQQKRGCDTWQRYTAMTSLNQLMQAENMLVQQAQNFAIRGLEKLPFFKKQLMRWGGLK